MPQRGKELPRRKPPGESQAPQSSGSFFERAQPASGSELSQQYPAAGNDPATSGPIAAGPADNGATRPESFPERTDPSPSKGNGLPQRRPEYDTRPVGEALPQRGTGNGLPQRGTDNGLPQRGTDNGLPQRNLAADLPQRVTDNGLPQRGAHNGLPQRSLAADLPQRGTENGLPQRGLAADLPQRGAGDGLPQRGADQADGLGALPRRTTRTRPSGRHRSPHRLSVASDAPALVIAVPGSAATDPAEIGPRVASIASQSCPGVEIRVGYLDGDDLSLSDCLALGGPDEAAGEQFPSVIVPLLLSPNARFDPVMRQHAVQPPVQAVLAGHLGPHPMVAEALHSRLAEAGLARSARSTGLSIAADGRGIVVLADVGQEAASGAGVAAVLLASRLSVPVVPASLGDPASIVDAVNRLSESGAQRPVLAPCLIGPETNVSVLDDLSNALNAPCAPTLGAHQAIGQLVAMRYGAALAGLSLAG